MPTSMETRGLQEIIQRMQKYPEKLKEGLTAALDAALLILWENVPPYPPPPEGSTYRRTGTLGKTLGTSDGGGQSGKPDIYTVKPLGSANFEAHFGTNLDYAPYVIGDKTQAWMHKGRWWIMRDVATAAKTKITNVFRMLGETMKKWLENQ
jgi:hypothetical protein